MKTKKTEKPTHTPGPWTQKGMAVEVESEYPGGYITIAFPACHITDQDIPVFEANARLIAAAPFMLNALKEAQRDIELNNKSAAIGTIRAAIAKAEGR